MLFRSPGLALANATAPRRLQSFAAAVHAEAEKISSVRSTVIAAIGASGFTRSALAAAARAVGGLVRGLVLSTAPILALKLAFSAVLAVRESTETEETARAMIDKIAQLDKTLIKALLVELSLVFQIGRAHV